MSDLARWPDSDLKRAEILLRTTVDGLLGCPEGRKEEAAREALAKLRPHLEAALEALEAIGRTRGLDEGAIAKQTAFAALMGLAGQRPAGEHPTPVHRSAWKEFLLIFP